MIFSENSIIPVTTLVDELLQPGEKATLLASGGYTLNNWGDLETDLRQLLSAEAKYIRSDKNGDYYEISGYLHHLPVKTIWLWEPEKQMATFINLFSDL